MTRNTDNHDAFIKCPRLYVDQELSAGAVIVFDAAQTHYLRHVLRRAPGAIVRVFNGCDGEWAAALDMADKKAVTATTRQQLKPQPAPGPARHLLFAPLKKARMDMLIEKATELGVTHLRPVITQNTETRTLKEDRIRARIIEAAEQCERPDLPDLFPPQPLTAALAGQEEAIPVYAALERGNYPALPTVLKPGPAAFLVGPEGGFTAEENAMLTAHAKITPVSLGPLILRSETAALYMLGQTVRENL